MQSVSLRKWALLSTLALVGIPLGNATAQSATAPAPASPGPAETPAARPEDVASINAIVGAVYDVISGPKGQERDWNRMRSLFAPGARLISARTKDGVTSARVLSVEDYIQLAGPMLKKDGFFEREAHRTEDRYGNIVQLFSTYESRHDASDAKPFQRGINSFQLMFDGKRWWVVTIYWQGETPEFPIPKQYGG
ncbi:MULTISPECIES: hypothetical protein [Dyella]|uniref:hypothetical protein n=1 Tax=Dyella TaxID=231454 RepID=UPI00197A73B1|nr:MULTISPECIES: hypothetical protein [Dyella]